MRTLSRLFPAIALFAPVLLPAFDGKVLAPGQQPADSRLGDPVTLHDYHPFRPVASAADWPARAAEIRTRVRVAAGLLPEPAKTPLNSVLSEKVVKDGFAIRGVYFESFPGHFVTGTLFTPEGESAEAGLKNGKRPVVLCPHGHWRNGRFYNAGDAAAKRQIAEGGERFYNAALNPIQARCVQLARMGCIAFLYDMLGNADSLQFEEHRRGPREEMNGTKPGQWGFVSPPSILRLQTNFGLQTWNSVRALDMILEHPEADPDRVFVTGASGGGTQTLILAAIDPRVDASFPCVMTSTAMQGGCTCENSYYLRIGQGNIDISAAPAPKPLGLTAADDWTRELETKGHPDLLDLYGKLKAPGAYEAHFDIHFKHNYNHVSRTHMYQFINRHFKLGWKSPVLESDFTYLPPEELTVWDEDGSRPANYKTGAEHERDLNRVWAEDGAARVQEAFRSGDLSELHEGWKVIIHREPAEVGDVEFELIEKEKRAGFVALAGLIRHSSRGEELPALFYYPDQWSGKVTLLLTPSGKAGLFAGVPASPQDRVKKWLDEGHAVAGVDLFGQGEFLPEGQPAFSNRAITYSGKKDLDPDSWQRSPVYYYGYNDSAWVRRVHDVLSAAKMIRTHPEWEVKAIDLVADGAIGSVALAAAAFSDGAFAGVRVNLEGFRFEKLDDSWGEHFVPGAVRFGDVAALAGLNAGSGLEVKGVELPGKLAEMIGTAP